MSLCERCKERRTCSVPCTKLNKYLKDNGIYSADWIRPRVSPKRASKDGIGKWREIPSGLLRPGINDDYAGDIYAD